MGIIVWAVVLFAAVIAVLLTCGWVFEWIAERRDRRRFRAPGRLVDVGGRRLHLSCSGTAPGPTVVIEQGAGGPSTTWGPVQARIASFARVCTYDRAGYLWSDPAPSPRTLMDRVADLHELLRRAEIPGPYVLVAHSLGGLLVRLFAREYPDEVAGMVLVDTPHETSVFKETFGGYLRQGVKIQSVFAFAAACGLIRLFGRFLPMMLLPEDEASRALCVGPQHVRLLRDDLRSIADAPAALRAPDAWPHLGGKPLIVIAHGVPFPGPAAAIESAWNDGQRQLAELSTDSELIVAEKSNHMIHLDEPEVVVDAVRRVYEAAKHVTPLRQSGPAVRTGT